MQNNRVRIANLEASVHDIRRSLEEIRVNLIENEADVASETRVEDLLVRRINRVENRIEEHKIQNAESFIEVNDKLKLIALEVDVLRDETVGDEGECCGES